MEQLSPEDDITPERYYRHFPKPKGYHQSHDFYFYRLAITDIRYIGGFGRIHWLVSEDFSHQNPFHGKSEDYIVSHMNEDHIKDLTLYCARYKQISTTGKQVRMVGIDAMGFDVFVEDRKVRFAFENPISDAKEAREALVALSKAAKA
jgi:putative heme iron utilization protein